MRLWSDGGVTPPDPSLPRAQLIEMILSLHRAIETLQEALAQAQADGVLSASMHTPAPRLHCEPGH